LIWQFIRVGTSLSSSSYHHHHHHHHKCQLSQKVRNVTTQTSFFLRSRSVSNDSSDSLFLRGVSMSPAWLKSLSTGADDGTLVLHLTNTLTTTGYFISCSLLKFMWWIIQKLESFNLASRVSNLRVWVMHTEAVEVVTGISFVTGLWSAATYSKSSDFSKKQVFSHLPQWCRKPSDFEV